MNHLTTIIHFFKKMDNRPTETDKKWGEGYKAFERGKQHYLAGGENHSVAGRIQDALDCFDKAIALGFEDGDIYGTRGSCLQLLEFHLDAIDDFNRAILSAPEDSNLYYMRSVSKSAIGDLHGCVADLKEAIRLSEIDSKLTKTYDLGAKKRGFQSATAMFNCDLLRANLDLEAQAEDEHLGHECERLGLDLPPNLVSRRRANTRRRMQRGSGP
jgi:tetratricopeptide (TPR) repeat protein